MNFLKKKLTKFAKKKVKEIVTAPRDQRNPQFQKLIDDTGDFLSKYTPGNIDATEFLEAALARMPWEKIFEDVEGRFYQHSIYDPDYLGEDDKPDREDEFDATEWDAEDSDFDQSVDQDDEEFIRRNQRYDGSSVRWIAPKCPTFIVDGTSMNDIKQNAVGDCWFLASLSSLATRPERIAFVINKHINETAWENEDDLVFKFFRLGKWKSYKVNYYLPDRIAALSEDNEYWVPYTEKAYAKRYKTYDAITGGWGAWGLTDLTGGIAIKTDLSWEDNGMHEIFAWLYENQQNLLITSGINGGSGGAGGEVLQDSGLYAGHEYSLLKLELVRNKNNKVIQMVHLRNPWGQGEFNGDWSDSSSLWKTIPRERREQLLVKREDGAFWMCYKDWIELFSSFDVCLLPSKFSESRSGPCFDAESVVNGVFEEDQPVIKVKMSVGAKRNVFLQCLLDCNIEFAKTNQFISVDLKDENEEYIKPILPNKYEELDPRILKVISGCGSVGYLLGEYEIEVQSLLRKVSTRHLSCQSGMGWMIRTVGDDVILYE